MDSKEVKLRVLSKNFIKVDNLPLICKICGKELRSKTGLGSHIKNNHSPMDYYSYIKHFFNIDILEAIKDWEKGKEEREKLRIIKSIASIRERAKPLSEERKEHLRNKLKGVFSLNWFIQNYGETIGTKKYNDRIENLKKVSFLSSKNSVRVCTKRYSKMSQTLFWAITEKLIDKDNIYFGELNHEFSCGLSHIQFDFVDLKNKKVIEFNGDSWHGNPDIYKESSIPISFINKTAKQLWKEDFQKLEKAKSQGYSVLVVWEKDYKENPNKVIEKCLKFLLESIDK